MDPERVRAYLQVACAGLGFDIGEVWWSSNESGSSTLASIEEKRDENGILIAPSNRQKRFVQLYTSKSYEDMRSILVSPDDDGVSSPNNPTFPGALVSSPNNPTFPGALVTTNSNSTVNAGAGDSNKHKLSPRLVDAISNTTQVLWANTEKREGLLGRSDLPLQTAVGMPVAVDANGNMCVVVMFSPTNMRSSDEAMDFLEFICRSATSSNIPCLLPVFDSTSPMKPVPKPSINQQNVIKAITNGTGTASLGDGVTARFVSLSDSRQGTAVEPMQRTTSDHDLATAPQDCFGIPMLPASSEIGNSVPEANPAGTMDAFDDVSYGVWSTIMNTPLEEMRVLESSPSPAKTTTTLTNGLRHSQSVSSMDSATSSVVSAKKPILEKRQQDRLEEFIAAFLGMSVFDTADVWIPMTGEASDDLFHVSSIMTNSSSEALNRFALVSEGIVIKSWSGAPGRAFASANPVWTSKRDQFVDAERAVSFETIGIQTVMAIPIKAGHSVIPCCVLCFYSLVKADPVPYVLRFVQQAVHLLWSGLERVQPHDSVGQEHWTDVSPTDLGEMAADTEMQQEFHRKKRSYSLISTQEFSNPQTGAVEGTNALSTQMGSVALHTSFSTSSNTVMNPQPQESPAMSIIAMDPLSHEPSPSMSIPVPAPLPSHQMEVPFTSIQSHLQDAMKSAVEVVQPWAQIPTNLDGSKRAHVMQNQSIQGSPVQRHVLPPMTAASPLTVPPSPAASTLTTTSTIATTSPIPNPTPGILRLDGLNQPTFATQLQQSLPVAPSLARATSLSPLQQPRPLSMPGPLAKFEIPPAPDAPAPPSFGAANQVRVPPTGENRMNEFSSTVSNAAPNLTQPPIVQVAGVLEMGVQHSVKTFGFDSSTNNLQSQPLQQAQQSVNYQSQQPNGQVVYYQATRGAPVYQATPNGTLIQLQPGTVPPLRPTASQICLPTSAPPRPNGVKVCRIQGCESPAVSRRPYCQKHSGNRLCEHPGCKKCAQGSTRFCIAHGGGRRCTFPGCDKGARDKYLCAAHGGGKRCQHPGCTKSAVGGSHLCTSHGGGRRCAVDGCDKSAQSSTKFCVKHGGGKKCAHPNCEKVARGRTSYCAAHGGGVRCKLEGCNRVAIGKLKLCRQHGGGSKARGSVMLSPANAMPPPMQPNGLSQAI